MSSFKKIVTVVAALVVMFGPMMQASQLSASEPTVDSQVCGTLDCCCCPMANIGGADDDKSTRECKCSLSESEEPLDVEVSATNHQVNRDRSYASSLSAVGIVLPMVSAYYPDINIQNTQAGKSPPAYILACALLI